jgi:hypothetical protein
VEFFQKEWISRERKERDLTDMHKDADEERSVYIKLGWSVSVAQFYMMIAL